MDFTDFVSDHLFTGTFSVQIIINEDTTLSSTIEKGYNLLYHRNAFF
jgi:hypothetical protein